MFKKPYKLKIISFILSAVFLFRGMLYANDTLRVPFSKDTNKRMKGEVLIKAILEGHRHDIEDLNKIKEEGFNALREKTKKLILNPKTAEWGVNVDAMTYYELYAFLISPLASDSHDYNFLKENPHLFNLTHEDKKSSLRGFISQIIQNMILKELEKQDLTEKGSPKEWDILRKYMFLEAEPLEEIIKKIRGSLKLLKSDQFQSDKEIVYKYCAILYEIAMETFIWSRERPGNDSEIPGKYDEHELYSSGIAQGGILLSYIADVRRLSFQAFRGIGEAKCSILSGEISEAILDYKDALLNCFSKNSEKVYRNASIEDLHPEALSLIRKELVWMMENDIPGVEEIISGLVTANISRDVFVTEKKGLAKIDIPDKNAQIANQI